MIDPIDSSSKGYVLDVKRLRELVRRIDVGEDTEVLITSGSVDDAFNVSIDDLEVSTTFIDDEEKIVITLKLRSFEELFNEKT